MAPRRTARSPRPGARRVSAAHGLRPERLAGASSPPPARCSFLAGSFFGSSGGYFSLALLESGAWAAAGKALPPPHPPARAPAAAAAAAAAAGPPAGAGLRLLTPPPPDLGAESPALGLPRATVIFSPRLSCRHLRPGEALFGGERRLVRHLLLPRRARSLLAHWHRARPGGGGGEGAGGPGAHRFEFQSFRPRRIPRRTWSIPSSCDPHSEDVRPAPTEPRSAVAQDLRSTGPPGCPDGWQPQQPEPLVPLSVGSWTSEKDKPVTLGKSGVLSTPPHAGQGGGQKAVSFSVKTVPTPPLTPAEAARAGDGAGASAFPGHAA
uniref:Uncharacterized protein n=1 Tax=Rangifer tarandus platyrhynchus TaxID=3082113 RepID=A0ACB0FGD2_RANTA|nr:unnamed protein product [Rangifer tarandus platyrhynchus]